MYFQVIAVISGLAQKTRFLITKPRLRNNPTMNRDIISFRYLWAFGYFLHMLPYTLGTTIFYSLFYKSRYIPRVLNLWGILAALLAFVGSLFEHLGFDVPLFVFIPNLPFDFAIGIWLMAKGIKVTENG